MADKDDPKMPSLPPDFLERFGRKDHPAPTDPMELMHAKFGGLPQQPKAKTDPALTKPDIKAKAAETFATGLSDSKKFFERAKKDAPGLAENAARTAQQKAKAFASRDDVKSAAQSAKAALKAIGVERHTLTARDKFARFLRANWKGVALFGGE